MEKKSGFNGKKLFLAVGSFLPVTVFQVAASTIADLLAMRVVALILTLFSAFFIFTAYRREKPTYFDWANCCYSAVALLSFLALPETAAPFYSRYAVTLMYGFLCGACFIPPLIGIDPFTMYYAKKSTPRDAWGNPIFIRINLIMTYVWAGLFCVCALLSLMPSAITRFLIPAALLLGFGAPFTKRFPDLYLKRKGLPTTAEQRSAGRETSGDKGKAVPRAALPSTALEAISKMPLVFNPQKAEGLTAVIAFEVSGSETFNAFLNIHDGICTCSVSDAPPSNPELTIVTPAEVWLAIARREMNGQAAFMKQAYTVRGNMGLLMRMQTMFGGVSSKEAPPSEKAS